MFVGLLIGNVKVYQTILAEPVLTVSVLEAGKSHAVLVKSPDGKTVLVDTGSDASILRALGESLPVWQRDIDVVILTSSAAGSAGGLPAIEDRYHISKIIHIGDATTPYGSSLTFGTPIIKILAPAILTISSGSSVFNISSSTPAGVYISKGQTAK